MPQRREVFFIGKFLISSLKTFKKGGFLVNKTMYWNLEDAIAELKKRQADMRLQEEIDGILGDCPIPGGLYGFLARHIATSRIEDVQFLQRCQSVGLAPIWLEYLEDKFIMNNPAKMRLIKIRALGDLGRNGGHRTCVVRLIRQPADWEGKPIIEIKTDQGENLVDVHRRLRGALGWNDSKNIIEASSWTKRFGRAEGYYKYLFLAMVTRGIFFESFESPGFPDLERFKRNIVLPAWDWVVNVKKFPLPLITLHPDCPPEEEETILNWYPATVLSIFNLKERKL